MVDAATIVTAVVTRGPLEQTVSAPGVVVPEHVRVIAAAQGGVIDQIFVRPGSLVRVGSAIAQMRNPQLTANLVTSQSALRIAEANLATAQAEARAAVLDQRTAIGDAEAVHETDLAQLTSYAPLYRSGLISALQFRATTIAERKSGGDLADVRAQSNVTAAEVAAKVAAARAQVDGAMAAVAADDAAIGSLLVTSGGDGIVQGVDVDPGANVAPAAQIARIADVRDLRVVLHVAESEISGLAIGMNVTLSSNDGRYRGQVARIAPVADNGTVAVDIDFDGAPPSGLRPSQNVDGEVSISRIADALQIARPANATDGASVDLFKVVPGTSRAVRVRVRLGRGTLTRVQIASGLKLGDAVIVSDTSNFLSKPEIRLR
jgi:multidrug efflux pump subunit AcrA (membrane-fusion protein)